MMKVVPPEIGRGFLVLRLYTSATTYMQQETSRDLLEAWQEAIALMREDATLLCVRLYGILPGNREIEGFVVTVPDASPYYVDYREKFVESAHIKRFFLKKEAVRFYEDLLSQNILASTNAL